MHRGRAVWCGLYAYSHSNANMQSSCNASAMLRYPCNINGRLEDRQWPTTLCASMGFTLPSAIKAFLRRSVAEQGFPFQLKAIDRYAMQWQCTVEEDAVRKVMTITAEKNHRKSERRKKLGLVPGKAYCVADIPESYFIECWKDDELERFIGSLPFDQVKDLQAIMYLGRGDYDTFNEARGDLERFGWGGINKSRLTKSLKNHRSSKRT